MISKFNKSIMLIIFMIGFLAIQDINGFKMFKAFNIEVGSEQYERGFSSYLTLFWLFALILGLIVSYLYFTFTGDKSEAVAVFIVYAIMILFGLEDILFYVFQNKPIPNELGWLMNNFAISRVAMIMKQSTVTKEVLSISVFIGAIISSISVKYLKRLN